MPVALSLWATQPITYELSKNDKVKALDAQRKLRLEWVIYRRMIYIEQFAPTQKMLTRITYSIC